METLQQLINLDVSLKGFGFTLHWMLFWPLLIIQCWIFHRAFFAQKIKIKVGS